MNFIHQRSTAFPITQVVLIFPRTGVCLDPEDLQGLTRLTLRLLFNGAGGLSNVEFNSRLERLGASAGASLSTDFFTLRLVTLTRNLDRALDLFLMAVEKPNMEEDEFSQLRSELLSSWITEREESKSLRAQEIYMNRLYRGLPNGFQQDGNEGGIRKMSIADVHGQIKTLFGRARPILGVLSDLSREEAAQRIVTRMNGLDIPPNGSAHPWDDFKAVRPGGRRITIIPDRGTETDEIIGGVFSSRESDPDWHIHRLIALVFGGDMNSRMFRIIRGEHGYSYGASCWFESSNGRCPRNQVSPFTMYTFPSVEHTENALSLFVSLYEELVAEGVEEEELNRAKEALINSHAFLRETPQKLLSLECDQALYGIEYDDEATNRDKIKGVTPADIQRVLRENHHPESLTLVMLGDPKRLEPLARKMSAVETIEIVEYPPKLEAG